ncbi:hypothetical protein GY15_21860 [Delftia sp. 670]|nr:hypothetical protein GY15_21860 [Delftia sp. 670]
MRDARGEYREAASTNPCRVADRAVDHDAAQLATHGVSDHDFSDECVGEVAARIHHDHVTWAGQLKCLVEHEVVARAGPDGQRGAGHAPAAVHGAQPRAASRHAGHAVADVGNRHVEIAPGNIQADSALPLQNLKTDHGVVLRVDGMKAVPLNRAWCQSS